MNHKARNINSYIKCLIIYKKDPAISANETKPYPAYTEGVKKDVWIKNENGEILFGKVNI